MKPTTLQAVGCKPLPNTRNGEKSTAYYLFNKECKYSFMVDNASWRAKNGTLNLPIVSDGSEYDLTRISTEMIYSSGTIMEMVDMFVDGASICIPSAADAADIYKRILNHLDMHLTMMQTRIDYMPPPVDDFRHMAEFATAIRLKALDSDENIDENVTTSGFLRGMPLRPTFSSYDVPVRDPNAIPKSITKMDSIERYLDMIGYND